jgi:ribonuclease BN (tRNA processing enzyme)
VEITILGSRGSPRATGAAFDRYGGDTSSVAVACSDDLPRLVLDAGTGLRRVADLLGDAPFRGSILLTHLHWDHTHGLPFAPAVDRDDAEVDLYLPAQGGDPLDILSRAMSLPTSRSRRRSCEAGGASIPSNPAGMRSKDSTFSPPTSPTRVAARLGIACLTKAPSSPTSPTTG